MRFLSVHQLAVAACRYRCCIAPFRALLVQVTSPCHIQRGGLRGDQPVTRPLPKHKTTQTQNKRTQTSCIKWESNPRSKRSSERRHFMC
jgi:hypothetical protein